MVSRRHFLHTAGAGLLGLAGCTGRNPEGSSTGSPTSGATVTSGSTGTPTPPTTGTSTESPDPPESVDVEGESPAWARNLDEPLRGSPTYVDGHLVVAAGETVYGLDTDSGETAWTLDAPAVPRRESGQVTAVLRTHERTVYALLGVGYGLGGRDYTLVALRPDGTERWRYTSDLGRYHEIAGFGGGTVVLPTHDDAISPEGEQALAVDLADGEERWRVETGDANGGSIGEDVAVIEAARSALDCFGLAGGDRRFRFAPDLDGHVTASAVGGGTVFAGLHRHEGDGPTLYALSARDGTEDWTVEGTTVTSLRYLDDLYVGGENVLRLAPGGTEKWRYDRGGLLTVVPFDDDALYTNNGGRVVGVRRRDGRELWTAEATELAIPRARGGDAVVSVDGRARTVFAHAVSDGSERWRASVPDGFGPRPVAGGGGAYLATERGSVLKVPI